MGIHIINLFQLKRSDLLLVAFIGSVLLLDSSIVGAQVVGAVPIPPSLGRRGRTASRAAAHGAPERIPPADRTRGQRVEPIAGHLPL
jgi:hypothetical protein